MELKDVYHTSRKLLELVGTEVDGLSRYELPLHRRLRLWRRGFLSRSDYLFDFESHGFGAFLSDYERAVRTRRINGHWNVALDNKLVFDWMLRPFDEHRMDVYGLLREGRFIPVGAADSARPDGGVASAGVGGDARSNDAGTCVRDLLERHGRVVLKWITGGGGNNVYICSLVDGEYVVNGERTTVAEFESFLSDLKEYLVCEFVEQSAFGEGLYPRTTNTLRIISMNDETKDEPFIPIVIYRIGSDRSFPMDNFSRGGLSAEVDVETGELGKAVQLPEGTELVRHAVHPDSGARIEGARVPGWEHIRERVLDIAAANGNLRYVGWDVVPTDDEGGFTVIEGNNYPGMMSLQAHRPLLADERTRAFYRRRGVVDR